MARDAEADPLEPSEWLEDAEEEKADEEPERVGPQPGLEPKDCAERFVDDVREDRTDEDETEVDRSTSPRCREPRKAQADAQVAEDEHAGGRSEGGS
jgi:hypothetical protein